MGYFTIQLFEDVHQFWVAFARSFLEGCWGVLCFEEIYWDLDIILLDILGIPKFGMVKKIFQLFCDANTGQKRLPYSGIGSQIPAKIWELGHYRILGGHIPHMTQ